MRNSFGTFTTLESEKEFAQYAFWFFVEKDARCVIEDLSHKPFEAFCTASKGNDASFYYKAFDYPATQTYFVNPESVIEFRDALETWQIKYNLKTDWIAERVCEILDGWLRYPKNYEILFLQISFGGIYETLPAPEGFDEFRTFDETPQSYAKRIADQAKEKINNDELLSNLPKPNQIDFIASAKKKAFNHAQEVQKKLSEKYPDLAPAKDLPSFEKHFTWLIKTYVLGKQFVNLSDEISVKAISKAVNKLADILNLPKPEHLKPGRKKGSKNNSITSKLGKDLK